MWTDSRTLQGLKLPAERHAIGYAASELWLNIGAATTEPETDPRLLARADSVATTAIDPPSGSDSDSPTGTADELQAEAATSNAADFVGLEFTAALLALTPGSFGHSSYGNRVVLKGLFRLWKAASQIDWAYPDGTRTFAWYLQRWTSARWHRATMVSGCLPLQPPWRNMVAAAMAPEGQQLTDACMLFGWHVSARFMYRKLLAAWAAVAVEITPLRRALKLAGNPLRRTGMFGLMVLEIAGFLGVAPWQTAAVVSTD